MSVLLASYSESNADSGGRLPVDTTRVGESFTPSQTANIESVQFYMLKTGSPTGNAVVKIYAHSGTFGTSSVPTGAALATSNNFNVAGLTGTPTLTSFTFPSPISLVFGTNYVAVLEYSGGDASNYIELGQDSISPTSPGNLSYWTGSAWGSDPAFDLCFYVYGADATSAIKTVLGLAKASVKTVNGLAIASVKTMNGLA